MVRHLKVEPAWVTLSCTWPAIPAFIHLLSKRSREVDVKLQRSSSFIRNLVINNVKKNGKSRFVVAQGRRGWGTGGDS